MNATEFEEIKSKVSKLKDKKTKAQGALEQIQTQLKTEHGLKSVDEAKEKAKDLADDIKKDTERKEELMKELEKVADWEDL
jgi:predicted  nucleic acid-binding Zn-ribbon protein